MFYKNAFFSKFFVTFVLKSIFSNQTTNEIIIKFCDKNIIIQLNNINENKIVEIINNLLKNQQINDVKIRKMIKLKNENLIIQTSNKKNFNKIKNNDN